MRPGAEGRSERRSRASTPPNGPNDPLELLLAHLHALVQVDAAVFVAIDSKRTRVEPVAQWFASAAVRGAIEPNLERPYNKQEPGLAEMVIERGRALFVPRVADWSAAPQMRSHFERHVGKPGGADALDIFNTGSVIACPVRNPNGQTLGALILASSDEEHPLRDGDVHLAEVLADLAALALDRLELLSAEAMRSRRETLLERAAEGMSGTLESEEVYARALEHAVTLTGADCGLLSRLQPGTSSLTAVAAWGDASEQNFDPALLGEVARLREARLCTKQPTSMHVPVVLGPRLFGVLSVAREGDPAFDDGMLDLLQKLAVIAAAGIANAIDFERERRIARALTRGFVPESLPSIEGHDVGLAYEPADSQATGGDLYGVWLLPNGAVGVLVGDVAGKGVGTAALSAMARFFIEARSWDCDRPGEVLAQANTMLCSRLPSDTFVTAFFGIVSEEGIRYANAGHPSPLVLSADDELGEAGGHGLPMGVEEHTTYEDRRIEFKPGDLMLAFTDGLVEARRGGHLYGQERLEDALVEASSRAPDLDQLVRVVFDDVRNWAGALTDDAVALAVRKR
jgi:GAF domain-containing protein